MKHPILTAVLICLTIAKLAGQTQPIAYGNNKEAGSFKAVNGINLYYEVYGTGKPLVLLHGNGGSIRSQTGRIAYFKQHYQVIAIDSRAHGKSVDTSKKVLTYVQMAEDVNALLVALKIDSAYVWGQSDGGILGLLLAIKHPERVAKLATYGANIAPGKKAVFSEIDQMVLDTLKTSKNLATKRLFSLLAYQPNITTKDLQKIQCPVLVMSGDRDAIRLEHSIQIFDHIKNSNLFIMPGATHFGSYEKPELFNLVLSNFFEQPFSKKSTVALFTGK